MKKKIMIGSATVGGVMAAGLLFVACAPQFGTKSRGQSLDRMKGSKQYVDGKFENTSHTPMMAESSLQEKISLFSKFIKGVEGQVPEDGLPVVLRKKEDFTSPPAQGIAVTWFGHSAVLIELNGKRIFADPMLGQRASPVSFIGSKRFSPALPINIEDLPPLDFVLLSHDHYDHLDYGSIQKLRAKAKHFIVPLGVAAHLEKWGVPKEDITEFDWWDSATVDGLFFAATPARHFSGRGLWDRNATLWCSWVLKSGEEAVYFGGDSGYDAHFKQIGEKYGPFDLTMLECGQYNQAWQYIHMMPEQTAQAHLDLKGDMLMPTHWGAFSLALHPWKEPIERLSKAAAQQNIKLATPIIGQTWRVSQDLPQAKWWEPLK